MKLKNTKCPRMYSKIKIYTDGCLVHPKVDFIDSLSCKLAQFLSNLQRPFYNQTCHHISKTKDFVMQLKDLHIEDDETIISFDVSPLSTNVSREAILAIVLSKLSNDENLSVRTNLTATDIVNLILLCLDNTYFTFNNILYRQIMGLPMGSQICPIIPNLFMEDIEMKALHNFKKTIKTWWRQVDNTFVIMKRQYMHLFLQFLNNQEENIKFTMELEKNKSIPFLDCLVTRNEKGELKTTMYRKLMTTDRYRDFHSCHSLSTKKGITIGFFK